MGKKRKKKFRGSRTHGRGTKSGRGAGERGGRGKAGLSKHKATKIAKEDPDYFGPKGFSRPQELVEEKEVINIYQLEERIERLLEEGYAEKDGETYEIDLDEAGYDKLLGRGTSRLKIKVNVTSASDSAIEKIEEAGGEVITEDKE